MVPGTLKLQPDLPGLPPKPFTQGPVCCLCDIPGRTLLTSAEALSCGPASGGRGHLAPPPLTTLSARRVPVTPPQEGVVGGVTGCGPRVALWPTNSTPPPPTCCSCAPSAWVPSPHSCFSSGAPQRQWPSSLPATGRLSSLDWGTCQFLPCGRAGYVFLCLSPLRSPVSTRTRLRPWQGKLVT